MAICEYCGKKVNILYTCPHCEKKFCKEHKQPENHECISLVQVDVSSSSGEEQVKNEVVSHSLLEEQVADFLEWTVKAQTVESEIKLLESIAPEESICDEPPIIEKPQQITEGPFEVQDLHIASFFASLENEPAKEKQENILTQFGHLLKLPKLPKMGQGLMRQILLVALVLVAITSVCLNGILYVQYDAYKETYTDTQDELIQTQVIRGYYDELLAQNSEIMMEYNRLDELYSSLMQEHGELRQDYNEILDFNRSINLAYNMTVTVPAQGNITLVYSIPFCGFITVSYNASGEVYTWIGGSNLTDAYFSRNPHFPETSSNFNFTVPVLPDVIFYIANPDETQSVEVTFRIDFTY